MNNLQKRILTSIIIFPLSIFFILKGGYVLLSFLLLIFFIANYELFSVFKKNSNILFLDLVLILSLFSIYYLAENSFWLLLWVVILVICSDIGGYVFGKIFKWKKLTKISPRKTISGVFGSYFLSIVCLFIFYQFNQLFLDYSFKLFLITIIFSTAAQAGDLTISYFKRLEKIKDTGKILPGHGGIFDRIDGLMFVVIIATFAYNLNLFP